MNAFQSGMQTAKSVAVVVCHNRMFVQPLLMICFSVKNAV